MELVYFVALGGLLLIVLLHAGRFSLLYVLVGGIVLVLNDLLCLLLVLYVGVFNFGLFVVAVIGWSSTLRLFLFGLVCGLAWLVVVVG